jgi:EAL domain-containing protein (putative c-di-GMP-specific phosphodiesterase class I)
VIDAAVAQAARWREDGLALPVSVNLLSATLLHDEDLVRRVQAAIGHPPDRRTDDLPVVRSSPYGVSRLVLQP